MATQLMVDLYGCDDSILNDMGRIKEIAHDMIETLHANIVEECFHQFEPIGITYIAVITTSHFSVHTWPENGYAAVDIFSCDESLPETAARILAESFCAKKYNVTSMERKIEDITKE